MNNSNNISVIANKLSKPVNFLATEFVIIVLGVFVALAADEWRESKQEDEVRSHLIQGLITDLKEDRVDYDEFLSDSIARAEAAIKLQEWSLDPSTSSFDEGQAARYIRIIGGSSRLETVLSTFNELTSTGSGNVINDPQLRLRISTHYGIANDRADLNDMNYQTIYRYRAALNDIGYSYVDTDKFDVKTILDNKKIMALVRENGAFAAFMPDIVDDLLKSNQDLISELEQLLN